MDTLKEKRKRLLKAIHEGLSSAYLEIRALEGYSGFKEFRLFSFRSCGEESDYSILKFYQNENDKNRVSDILENPPMYAQYMAIAQEGKYRKRVSTELVKDEVIDASNILAGWRNPADVVLVGAARETIFLGLGKDSLVVHLNVFSPKLKTLEPYM